MANEEHLKILRQGVEVWNRWRIRNPDLQPNLTVADLKDAELRGGVNLNNANLAGADLRGAILTRASLNRARLFGAYLKNANLREADLSEADITTGDLREADLYKAKLNWANLSKAYFGKANLSRAILTEASFYQANLIETNLHGAELTRTNFSESTIGYLLLIDVDLSRVKGLETVNHKGPSHIDIHTLYRSKGNIPEVFLRGAGAPDTLITYAASLTSEAIQYYSCFISYSNRDEIFAQPLHADLQQKGVRCWFAPEDMKIGDKIRPRIDESIRIHDKLLLILSEHSINSTWVEKEVETAFEEERKRNQIVLFPVRLDEAVMETDQAWAADIRRTRHIGDFSRWQDHDAYQQAFERLLRDLKAES